MLKHRDTFEREHRNLLEALEARDAERAARLLEAHLAGASEQLVTELEAEASEAASAADAVAAHAAAAHAAAP
jgi:DNA-binding GntR family transcriptional regulator